MSGENVEKFSYKKGQPICNICGNEAQMVVLLTSREPYCNHCENQPPKTALPTVPEKYQTAYNALLGQVAASSLRLDFNKSSVGWEVQISTRTEQWVIGPAPRIGKDDVYESCLRHGYPFTKAEVNFAWVSGTARHKINHKAQLQKASP